MTIMVPKMNMTADSEGKEQTIAHHQIITPETRDQGAAATHGVPSHDDETDTGGTIAPHPAPLQSRSAKIIGGGGVNVDMMPRRLTRENMQVGQAAMAVVVVAAETEHLHTEALTNWAFTN